MRTTIRGLQEAQDANARALAAMQPSGALGRAVQWGTATAHRYAVGITPVDTGAWRAAHRQQLQGLRGRVYLEPGARNPRSRSRVLAYAGHWERQGGRYAIYRRTEREAGPQIAASAIATLIRGLP